MKASTRWGAGLSLLLHAAILFRLLYTPTPIPSPPPEPRLPGEVQVTLIPLNGKPLEERGDEPGINGAPDPKICAGQDSTYEGIGILHNIGTLLIISAPAGYPGYDAGLRVGDEIVQLIVDRRDPRYRLVEVLRYPNKTIKKRIKTEKICFLQTGERK